MTDSKKVIALVFARGGSKGLPGKNILPLGNTPLLGHSIMLANRLQCVDNVYVSTDDEAIKAVALEYGAKCIDRPEPLARDDSKELDAWRHAIQWLENQAVDFDVILSLPTTSPMRSIEDVEACVNLLNDETDAVITVTPASRNPYFNMVRREKNGETTIFAHSSGYANRQEAPEVYDMTTVAYVVNKNFVKTTERLLDGRVKSVVVPKERAIDIDDALDYEFAKLLWRNAHEQG